MLETHLSSPVTIGRLRRGPAADYVDAFADWLHLHGYKSISITHLLRSLAGWTDWMLAAGLGAQDLLAGFEACQLAIQQRQRARRGPNQHSLTAAALFIRFLQNEGALPLPVTGPSITDRWPVLGDFRLWMRQHRGLTETTLDVYQGILVSLLDVLGDDAGAYSVQGARRADCFLV
jgi:integrase/recombinase XerD